MVWDQAPSKVVAGGSGLDDTTLLTGSSSRNSLLVDRFVSGSDGGPYTVVFGDDRGLERVGGMSSWWLTELWNVFSVSVAASPTLP